MSLSDLNLAISYRTGEDDPVNDFYIPCLNNSNYFYRAVGYFRSSIFLITGEAVIEFVKKGGKIMLICSPELTKEDIDAIESGKANLEDVSLEYISDDLEKMLELADSNYNVKVLATLVKLNAISIQIAFTEKGNGIFHSKLGIFKDNKDNMVSFIGSANESWSAWHETANREHVEVFCSWKEDKHRVLKHKGDFDRLWNGTFAGVKTVAFPDAMKQKLVKVALDNIDSIDYTKIKKIKSDTSPLRKIDSLRLHQITALESWKKNNYAGILQHATGSGKTITAIAAINEHVKDNGVTLILVPSNLLHKQWTKELSQEMDLEKLVLLKAGAGNNSWKEDDRLSKFVSNKYSGNDYRVVISTMQTACQKEFIDCFNNLNNLLIVIDEVHQIGSSNNSNSLNINAKKRLGLSATPNRYGDPEGTAKIFEYFTGIVEPKVSLYDAIKSGALVDYEYFPHLLNLTADEADEWKLISLQIVKEIAISNQANKGKIKLSQRAKNLLIKRSRIAKKSLSKLPLVRNVMKEFYSEGERWLIYCADKEQLNDVSKILNELKITNYEYYSDMTSDNEEVLKLFQLRGGVLVSIKCLDEGVDIPSISHAFILASSQNPREFIQRRGRVLRRHDSKQIARIHDAIIIPLSLEDEPEQMSLLKSELIRSYEFSQSALNRMAGQELFSIATKLGINLNEFIEDGYEEEDISE